MSSRPASQHTTTGRSSRTCPTTLVCAACLDISTAHELYHTLQHALDGGRPIVLEAARVERIDTAILQLLYAFVQEARMRGLEVRWHQPSQIVQQAAYLLALHDHLGLITAASL